MFFYSPGGKALINDPETEKPLTGVVLNGAHGIYDVHTDDVILRCTLRGKLKKAFAQAQSAKSIEKVRPRHDKLLATTRRTERMDGAMSAILYCLCAYPWETTSNCVASTPKPV